MKHLSLEETHMILCKNPLKQYPHYIYPSPKISNHYHERLGYCGVCWRLGFTDNAASTNPEPYRKRKPYPNSKINPNSGPCGNDTL